MPKIIVDAWFQYRVNVIRSGRRNPEWVAVHERVPVELNAVDAVDEPEAITIKTDAQPPNEFVRWCGHGEHLYSVERNGTIPLLHGFVTDYTRTGLRVGFEAPPVPRFNHETRSIDIADLQAAGIRSWIESKRDESLASLQRLAETVLVLGPERRILLRSAPPRWCIERQSYGSQVKIEPFYGRGAPFAVNPAQGSPTGVLFPWAERERAEEFAESLHRAFKARGVINAPPPPPMPRRKRAYLAADSIEACAFGSTIGLINRIELARSVQDFPGMSREALSAWCDMRDARESCLDGKPALPAFREALDRFMDNTRGLNTHQALRPHVITLQTAWDAGLLAPMAGADEDLDAIATSVEP